MAHRLVIAVSLAFWSVFVLQKGFRHLEVGVDAVRHSDLLISELRWLIDCTALSEEDRRFAELRYIQGKKAKDIMEELEWYSTKTFSRHNKKVWARLVQTLHRLVG